jgi:peptide subunit release factor 1 (eRF1)
MTLPIVLKPEAVSDAITRLATVQPGDYRVVSCYLKLEPRDKAHGKYLIKMKNRVREAIAALARDGLERAVREQVAADLTRVLRHLEEPGRLPAARGIAVFACEPLGLFEVFALPQVHRSRLGVAETPLIRELVALEEEVGTISVAVCDRMGARLFEVTAFDVAELPGLPAPGASRTGRFHGERQTVRGGLPAGGSGEHNYHNRIRTEKQRHYARVADQLYQLAQRRPLTGIVVAGVGVDADAVVPHLHSSLHDLLLGVVRLNPKKVSLPEVREAALALREERERAWERSHAEAIRENAPVGWAVVGIEATLKALARGQVRILLADGQVEDPRIEDAIEDALSQRAQVDVVYDQRARRGMGGLAALLRFRR